MYFLYIIKSKIRNTFYIGVSSDPIRRLDQHNAGSTKSTKRYKPWKLIHQEKYETKLEACKREWFLKHPSGFLEEKGIIKQYGIN